MSSRLPKKRISSTVKLANLTAENFELKSEDDKLNSKIVELESQLKVKMSLEVLDPFLGDPSPKDTEQRKLYVNQVAGVYKEILEPKIKFMIANLHLMLEDTSNDTRYDDSAKGAISALRGMLLWGQAMVNESVAFQTGELKVN